MEITENGLRIFLLGDPHLGRTFLNGVPLHRRGDREKMVWQDFLAALDRAAGCDFHVCLGDLFDKWIVSFDLILKTADAYRKVALANPNTRFMILKGNHDWTRDLERRSAFDVFAALMRGTPNVTIVDKPIWLPAERLAFYPWHPLWEAKEVANMPNANILFGHFDVEFGEHNMVPTELHYDRIYTGHDHKARTLTRHGTEVVVVGSMQPYAHGEEPDDSLYVTLTADQLAGAGDLHNKCVRIIGRYEEEIDCLQLTFKQEKSADDDQLESVTLGDFDMGKLFAEAFAEAGVSAERTATVLDQYHSKRTAAGV
ncbi:metallophosphoesterase [Ensifer sp. ENS04]|uniref:metallophosphoesterase family protein n=1 Tax=Ensifer sp. ENS04 TaxID=2769281 RepID=UPI0017863CA9|nr:metallophosphoesterase [Ensifer sp. ENS04]MBD9544223.1 metallophosphoesterase [Ensifer sp. ENS04]